jgi:carbon-monoxide dehydrogenase medium subunit
VALHLLAEHGEEAKVLAGGQSLIPVMKLRLAAPAHLVDIGRLGLDTIAEADGSLAIGALARHRDLERSDLLKARYPVMAAAAPLISDPIVRNLGTIGGSLCHADPAGDWGSVMLALQGSVVLRSEHGERELPISEFFQDTFTTALEPDEILTEVRVPQPAGPSGGTYSEARTQGVARGRPDARGDRPGLRHDGGRRLGRVPGDLRGNDVLLLFRGLSDEVRGGPGAVRGGRSRVAEMRDTRRVDARRRPEEEATDG